MLTIERDQLADLHPTLDERHRAHRRRVSGGAFDAALLQFNENGGLNYHARDFRRWVDRLLTGYDVRASGSLATSGNTNGGVTRLLPSSGGALQGDMAVRQRGAGANMSVDVQIGAAVVGNTESITGGNYFGYNDAVSNVPITASDATRNRITTIALQALDTEYGDASDKGQLIAVDGALTAGTPTPPALPVNSLRLVDVTVGAAVGTIVNANIADKRYGVAAQGGDVVALTDAAVLAIPNPYGGQNAYSIATDSYWVYSATLALWVRTNGIPHTNVILRAIANNANINNGAFNTTTGLLPASSDATALTMSFTKYRADTTLVLRHFSSMVLAYGVSQGEDAGILMDSTTGVLLWSAYAVTGTRFFPAGSAALTGVASGSHTFQPSWGNNGPQTLSVVAGLDFAGFEVEETL